MEHYYQREMETASREQIRALQNERLVATVRRVYERVSLYRERMQAAGAGEILLTSMDCDGTKAGYDLELTRMISENVGIPVIASGGAGTKEHFYEALTEGKADAALAASLFHYKELEINDLKRYLRDRSISVRL